MQCIICGGDLNSVIAKEANVSCGDYFEGRRLYPEDLGNFHLKRCAMCGFSGFEEFAAWSRRDFQERIYNSDYHLCDSPFEEERPRKISAWLTPLIDNATLLDFGGGEGALARMLVQEGKAAATYDPFYGFPDWPADQYDFVTAFEVVEHVPSQHDLFEQMISLLAPRGVLVFSTLLIPREIGEDWWYASPRNGHVCFHTPESLNRLGQDVGVTVKSLSQEMHVAARSVNDLERVAHWRPPPVNDRPLFKFTDKWREMSRI